MRRRCFSARLGLLFLSPSQSQPPTSWVAADPCGKQIPDAITLEPPPSGAADAAGLRGAVHLRAGTYRSMSLYQAQLAKRHRKALP